MDIIILIRILVENNRTNSRWFKEKGEEEGKKKMSRTKSVEVHNYYKAIINFKETLDS